MTWSEIKKAVEDAGIAEGDEVSVIQCQAHDGDKTLCKIEDTPCAIIWGRGSGKN
jgi:hypothetical protein